MGRLLRRTLLAVGFSHLLHVTRMEVIKQRLDRVHARIWPAAIEEFANEAHLDPCIKGQLLKASRTDFGQLLMEIFSDWDVH